MYIPRHERDAISENMNAGNACPTLVTATDLTSNTNIHNRHAVKNIVQQFILLIQK